MSADNWTWCPKHQPKSVRGTSGDDERHFREDWEIGVDDDGEFYVNYRGGCSVCGFSHAFNHSAMLP